MFKINAENIIQTINNGLISGLGAQEPNDVSLFNGQQKDEDFSFTKKINVKNVMEILKEFQATHQGQNLTEAILNSNLSIEKQLEIIDKIKTELVIKSNQIGVKVTALEQDYIKAVENYRNSTEENCVLTKNKLTEIMNEYPKRIEIKNRLIEATKAHKTR